MSRQNSEPSNNYRQLRDELLRARPALRQKWDASLPKRRMALALVHLRKRAGLTQVELAEKAGWDKAFVSRLESASGGMPDSATLVRYAECCGAVAGFVFGVPAAQGVHIVDAVTLSGGYGPGSQFERLRETDVEAVPDAVVAAAN